MVKRTYRCERYVKDSITIGDKKNLLCRSFKEMLFFGTVNIIKSENG